MKPYFKILGTVFSVAHKYALTIVFITTVTISGAAQTNTFPSSGNVGIGTPGPTFKLQVIDTSNTGLRVQTNVSGGTVASFGGYGEFAVDAPFIPGGRFRIAENGNVGIGGTMFSDSKLTVSGTGIIRSTINSNSNAGLRLSLNSVARWSVATTAPGDFQIFNDANGQNALLINGSTNNAAIGTTPNAWRLSINTSGSNGLQVSTATAGGSLAEFGPNGDFNINSTARGVGGRFQVTEGGTVRIGGLAVQDPGGGAPNMAFVCVDTTGALFQCWPPPQQPSSNSVNQYTKDVSNFSSGLGLIRRLRPVSFKSKQVGTADWGLTAKEVAEVEPLLGAYNKKGEIEGVTYDRLGVVLINAVKEQQSEIEAQKEKNRLQQKQIQQMRQEIYTLKDLVCELKPEAPICRELK